jgi:hypothetical protein
MADSMAGVEFIAQLETELPQLSRERPEVRYERLVLRDETGEVYGAPGAEVEFDLYVYNDKTACLIEAKSYLKPSDVLIFHRKVRFAEGKLGRPVTHQSQLKPHVGGFALLPLDGGGERRG